MIEHSPWRNMTPAQWDQASARATEQPDPGDQIPDVENDPVPEEPEPEGEPE